MKKLFISFLVFSFCFINFAHDNHVINAKSLDEGYEVSETQKENKQNVYDLRNECITLSRNINSSFDYAYSDFDDTYLRTINLQNPNGEVVTNGHQGSTLTNPTSSNTQPMFGQVYSKYNNVYCLSDHIYRNITYRGTGYLIGKNMVLTAGHMTYIDGINEGDSLRPQYNEHFADECRFYPNYDNGNISNYTQASELIIDDKYYYNGDPDFQASSSYCSLKNFNYDWSIIILTQNIGDQFGSCGLKTNKYNLLNPSYVYGFPGSQSHHGVRLTSSSASSENDYEYRININSLNYDTAGISGGPIISEYVNNLPISYGIYTSQNNPNYYINYGVKLNNAIYELAEAFGNGYY
ncbi:MAG: hypothetical protein WCR97_05440 [Bacilli bacterium]